MTRPRKGNIIVNINTLGGKVVDPDSRADGRIIVYDADNDRYVHIDLPEGGLVQYNNSNELPETGNPGVIYYVINESTSYRWDTTTNQYVTFSSPVRFSDILEKPTTLAGYGIVDAWTKTDIGDPTLDYVEIFENALI